MPGSEGVYLGNLLFRSGDQLFQHQRSLDLLNAVRMQLAGIRIALHPCSLFHDHNRCPLLLKLQALFLHHLPRVVVDGGQLIPREQVAF